MKKEERKKCYFMYKTHPTLQKKMNKTCEKGREKKG